MKRNYFVLNSTKTDFFFKKISIILLATSALILAGCSNQSSESATRESATRESALNSLYIQKNILKNSQYHKLSYVVTKNDDGEVIGSYFLLCTKIQNSNEFCFIPFKFDNFYTEVKNFKALKPRAILPPILNVPSGFYGKVHKYILALSKHLSGKEPSSYEFFRRMKYVYSDIESYKKQLNYNLGAYYDNGIDASNILDKILNDEESDLMTENLSSFENYREDILIPIANLLNTGRQVHYSTQNIIKKVCSTTMVYHKDHFEVECSSDSLDF